MEEKEVKKTKNVRMNVVKGGEKENATPGKLTYEQLNQVCSELSEQNQKMRSYIQTLRTQMGQIVNNNALQRLGFLFEVLKYKDQFNSDFVISCVDEIKTALTIPENKDEEEKKS